MSRGSVSLEKNTLLGDLFYTARPSSKLGPSPAAAFDPDAGLHGSALAGQSSPSQKKLKKKLLITPATRRMPNWEQVRDHLVACGFEVSESEGMEGVPPKNVFLMEGEPYMNVLAALMMPSSVEHFEDGTTLLVSDMQAVASYPVHGSGVDIDSSVRTCALTSAPACASIWKEVISGVEKESLPPKSVNRFLCENPDEFEWVYDNHNALLGEVDGKTKAILLRARPELASDLLKEPCYQKGRGWEDYAGAMLEADQESVFFLELDCEAIVSL